jgi:butanol dehydrogenase
MNEGELMDNFKFHASTEILFGKDQIRQLPEILSRYGHRVLLAYGGGSIVRNGIYATIQDLLSDFTIIDYPGIEPNPRISSVRRGVELARTHHAEVILAVGGGSVIDCSKVVGAGVYYDGDPWDLVMDSSKIGKVLPIVSVLTLAGTGSEMNRGAVITHEELQLKKGTGGPNTIPKVSIVDPTYLTTLPAWQTAAGSADILSHLLEQYFKKTPDAFVQDRVAEGLMQTVIHYAPIALEHPTDYSARANLAYASSLALNGMTGAGKGGAWSVHAIEHELSAYYDLTHGIGLAILTLPWMRHILCAETVDKFVDYAVNVWKIVPSEDKFVTAKAGIDATEAFFKCLNIPLTLRDVQIDDSKFDVMAKRAVELGHLQNAYVPLDENDVMAILKACLD